MTYIRDLKIDSGNDYATATIVIARAWGPGRTRSSDLPEDVRDALVHWLGLKREIAALAEENASVREQVRRLQEWIAKHPEVDR